MAETSLGAANIGAAAAAASGDGGATLHLTPPTTPQQSTASEARRANAASASPAESVAGASPPMTPPMTPLHCTPILTCVSHAFYAARRTSCSGTRTLPPLRSVLSADSVISRARARDASLPSIVLPILTHGTLFQTP
jgi:hypothetical protein